MGIPGIGIAKDIVDGARDLGDKIVDGAEYGANFAVGAGMEFVNLATRKVRSPGGSSGDTFEPRGGARDTGADFIDAIGRVAGVVSDREDYGDTRSAQPLLATVTARGERGATVHVAFDADAPGNDWSQRDRASTLVSVYVDGRYHSDVVVIDQRLGGYDVNLGELSPGTHRVELRSAHDRAPDNAARAKVHNVAADVARGDQALIDRHQPIFEARDLGSPGGGSELAYTDTPLLVVPFVSDNRDGTRTIEYRLLLSNEDHGTSTLNLFRDWGRTVDFEAAYRVTVDSHGNRVRDEYEGPAHHYFAFHGRRDGDRPILRIATGNNNFSQRLHDAGARWSGAVTQPMPRAATSVEVMLAHPWTWEVMAAELRREHGHEVGELPQNVDARRYLYVGPVGDGIRDHLEQRKALKLVLRDGSVVKVVSSDHSRFPEQPGTVLLPTGVDPDDVTSIRGVEGTAFVLDSDNRPRMLPSHDSWLPGR